MLDGAIPSMERDDGIVVLPFLKWAGGKRWLSNSRRDLLPLSFDRYVEPFAGSASLFFQLQPQRAILADLNGRLIATYQALQDDHASVLRHLRRHALHHNDEYYYEVRKRRCRTDATRAAQFIYLNRTCWNGLYRVNLKGEFNVPRGTKNAVLLPTDDFDRVAKLLNRATLKVADFEETLEHTGFGDFVFIDPPYTVRHNHNGFIKYNDQLFRWQDQVRLRDAVLRAYKRGAKLLILNANHDSIRELYEDVGRHLVLSRASVLAADAANRGRVEEIAIQVW